jgi:hypothetical protein
MQIVEIIGVLITTSMARMRARKMFVSLLMVRAGSRDQRSPPLAYRRSPASAPPDRAAHAAVGTDAAPSNAALIFVRMAGNKLVWISAGLASTTVSYAPSANYATLASLIKSPS